MCDHSKDPGGREAAMTVVERDANGAPTVWCDPCIAPLISALNNAGVQTIASCCGHGTCYGWIMLRDGRDIVIYPDHESNLAANDPQLFASMQSAGEFVPDRVARLRVNSLRALSAREPRVVDGENMTGMKRCPACGKVNYPFLHSCPLGGA